VARPLSQAEQADPNSADSAQAGYDAPLGTFALAEVGTSHRPILDGWGNDTAAIGLQAQLNNFHAVQPVSSLAQVQVQSQGQQLEVPRLSAPAATGSLVALFAHSAPAYIACAAHRPARMHRGVNTVHSATYWHVSHACDLVRIRVSAVRFSAARPSVALYRTRPGRRCHPAHIADAFKRVPNMMQHV
jgi:hypothetical protein